MTPADARARMIALHRAPEPEVLAALLPAATLDTATRQRVMAQARLILQDLKAAQSTGWVNRFLQEYRLNTAEGVALLSLAEAYLRVPDPETANLLIRDKIGDADWRAHKAKSGSALVNTATFGLILTRALVEDPQQAGTLKKLITRMGEPVIRQGVAVAMKMMGEVFVMGRTIDEALDVAAKPEIKGFTASFDMLGESARTFADAEKYFAAYEQALDTVGRSPKGNGHSISIKLSALHPRYEVANKETCVPQLIEMIRHLAAKAAGYNMDLTIDAEETERLMISLDIIEGVLRDPALSGWDGLGMAAQAYGKRARPLIGWAQAIGQATSHRLKVRLVKGAYWDSEIKRAQVEGLSDYPLFTRKPATDVSYLACATDMLDASHIWPAFASHNALTVATIMEWAGERRDFEFQRLHGMGEGLHERLVRELGYSCRTYAPVGGHKELLAYLVRRLLENGANSSFVHQLADPTVNEETLLSDPAAHIAAVKGRPHPAIPLPAGLFPGRTNSQGLDLSDQATLDATLSALATVGANSHAPTALVSGQAVSGTPKMVLRPADPSHPIGTVIEASAEDVSRALKAADAAADRWAATPVEDRAACLERLADLMETHRLELMGLCVHEAGKTIGDAVAEIREAVDFCRYYAVNAREQFRPVTLPGPTGELNELRLTGRGTFACISPWNFPLAIFIGQVTAALVAGNPVVAKPAPQTPLIAFRAVQLAHEAGIPADVLHFLPGGPDVGAALTASSAVHGVAFTGSTGTARAIARSLLSDDSRPLVPLIAETGGLNAMIVDSTALPEQVVGDVVTSAFRSAGQRCSALRLLIVQEDVADTIIHMLKGAMDTLVLGDPADIRTDVGPVIDAAARDKLLAYRQSMQTQWIHTLEVPQTGLFVPPTLIRLNAIEDLSQEWFGPILHVVTWRAGELDSVVARVNARGYGLTMGLHSRVAETAERVKSLAKVGNLYVNRSMIGAVVGSQPFGGEGLSGTGPKAGGPHYLLRFASERTVSVDTTSAGGNATLLSLAETDI
ncbi:bifunctional proline dehydrogenase/L-glutamate gamma-semialdehyde dehydrogenase PutA [Asticcacaulis sp.]|uniref:bifunctional proline dehydrogenase/L-glutamate gamma-semialdehyde dehydrogenase PutA n=1 Tax=Asticcacaulis sp. TaxID=1872648 RepID=UPI00391BB017